MIIFAHLFSIILLYLVLGQIPTDYPPVRSKEVPDHLQDQVKWFTIVGGSILILLLVGYFMRIDKKIARWLKK
jgi:hypothetical protein